MVPPPTNSERGRGNPLVPMMQGHSEAPRAGAGRKNVTNASQLSLYEQKMMRRLEKANKQAACAAAGVNTSGPKRGPAQQLPAATDGPDHERLLQLAREAREAGSNFYYFPVDRATLAQDARSLDKCSKEEKQNDEALKGHHERHPQLGVHDFFSRLEEMQQERRHQITEQDDAEETQAQSRTVPSAVEDVQAASRQPEHSATNESEKLSATVTAAANCERGVSRKSGPNGKVLIPP